MYLRYGLSYRDMEELLAERGITVNHVTVYRWVQRFTPLLIDAARPCRHAPGDRHYSDVLYVEKLIAPGMINSMPEQALRAFANHGTDGTAT